MVTGHTEMFCYFTIHHNPFVYLNSIVTAQECSSMGGRGRSSGQLKWHKTRVSTCLEKLTLPLS